MLHAPDFLDFIGTLPTWLVMAGTGVFLLVAWDLFVALTKGLPR